MNNQIGFGNSLRPTRIFVGKESGSLWYLWDEENQKPIPIDKASLSGYIKAIETISLTSDYGISSKLILTIEADKLYQIQTGFETWAAKTLLLSLAVADGESLSRIVSIEPFSNSNSKVIFLNLYNWEGKKFVSQYKWEKDNKGKYINEPDFNQILRNIAELLKPKESSFMPENLEETFTDPDTGEVIF
jgi:hypothetical protein